MMEGNIADTANGRLHLAAQQNDVPGVEHELASGTRTRPVTSLPIALASVRTSPHCSKFMPVWTSVEWSGRRGPGAEVDYIDPVFCWTALHIASLDGKADAVEFLLRAGADPDIANDSGNTALHMASRNGQVSCVGLLCSAGANLAIVNEAGNTARDEAAERVTRQYRFNGTSHRGVLEVIDKEIKHREWRLLCVALQRLAFAGAMHERLGSASALQTVVLPLRTADGCWELLDLVIPPHPGTGKLARAFACPTAPAMCTLQKAESEGWAWRDHQTEASASSVHATAEEADAPPQQSVKGQRGKVMGGTWIPTGSALHDAVNAGDLSKARSELEAVRGSALTPGVSPVVRLDSLIFVNLVWHRQRWFVAGHIDGVRQPGLFRNPVASCCTQRCVCYCSALLREGHCRCLIVPLLR